MEEEPDVSASPEQIQVGQDIYIQYGGVGLARTRAMRLPIEMHGGATTLTDLRCSIRIRIDGESCRGRRLSPDPPLPPSTPSAQ